MEEGFERLKAHMWKTGRHYWIREQGTRGNIGDIQKGLGQMAIGVKISLPASHNTSTSVEDYVQ